MPELNSIAACPTTAGACEPMGADNRSPVPIRERVVAASQVGFAGFGIRHEDLLDVERTFSFAKFFFTAALDWSFVPSEGSELT
jgi:hypothetical protein